ncbi:MAG: alkaline phosphatase family protein [Chloroflexi bacterium]|nr:alkaline phosphatase family protein [Chloroflexota bacterium]
MNAAPRPRYGEASLADLTPSILAALDVPGFTNTLQLPKGERIGLLIVDGLGWELLREYEDHAPFLTSLAQQGRHITSGFPSTTAASVASIGTGLTPGEHGLLGYTMALPGHSQAMNVLQWCTYGPDKQDLSKRVPPEQVQPRETAFQTACAHGVDVLLVAPAAHEKSGLSRAGIKGGRFRSAVSAGDLVAGMVEGLAGGERVFVYGHHNELDTTGHARGCHSDAWRYTLRQIDRMCRSLADELPKGTTLIITGDHGMVDLGPAQKLDLADHPKLAAGVRLMAGEGRARYLYADYGAAQDVLGAWREEVGDRMWVLSRDEAIEAGWFGPWVADEVRARIGDVVAAASGPIGIFQRTIDSGQAGLVGHHGSLTPAEQLVPLLKLAA